MSPPHSPFSVFRVPFDRLVRRPADAVLSVLLAPRCLVCGTIIDVPSGGPVCADCWQAIHPLTPPLCDACGDAVPAWQREAGAALCVRCRRRPSAISRGRAAGAYEGALRSVLHALKYEGRRTLAVRVAVLMRERGAAVLEGADLVVPVPLHWRRRHARGFNQAEDLASPLGLPVVRALRRVRATRPQFGLPASERHRNLRGAFAPRRPPILGPWFCRIRRHSRDVRGASVVLVDDVTTTGATLQACALELRAMGARDVRALTAARALTTRR